MYGIEGSSKWNRTTTFSLSEGSSDAAEDSVSAKEETCSTLSRTADDDDDDDVESLLRRIRIGRFLVTPVVDASARVSGASVARGGSDSVEGSVGKASLVEISFCTRHNNIPSVQIGR